MEEYFIPEDYSSSNCSDYHDKNCLSEDWDLEGPSELGPPQIAALVCYALVFLLGAPGNAVVVWVTACRMPRSVNSQWFRHLALADLLCCLSLPLLMVPLARDQHWPYGATACPVLTSIFNLTMYCSVLLLVLISVDRWLLVSRPVWCQNRRSPERARWACLGVWVLALLLSTPHFLYTQEVKRGEEKVVCIAKLSLAAGWTMTCLRSLLGFVLPFLAIAMCHWAVYTRTARGGRGQGRSQRTVRVICAVVLSFFLCLLPLHVTDFLLLVTPDHSPQRPAVQLAMVLTLCLAYLNSCLNPLLYVCLGRSFKASLRQSLGGIFSFMAEEPTRPTNSFTNTKSTTDNLEEKTV